MYVFFDTETTNKYDFKAAWNDPCQPDLVQLGYEIYDKHRTLIKSVDVVVDTYAWPTFNLADEAVAVHGITKERIVAEGVNPLEVAQTLVTDFGSTPITIAHNNDFDIKILNLFLYRAGFVPNLFDGKFNLDTMRPLTNILKIPSPNGRGFKWPKLDEAYRALVDKKGFEGAHDAMTDVRACRDVFWTVWDAGIVPQYSEARTFTRMGQ